MADLDLASLALDPSPPPTPLKSTDQLVQLTQLIQSSVASLERICDEKDLTFPSIDAPGFDPASEAFREVEGASAAADTIVAAAYQLIAAVMPPPSSVLSLFAGFFPPAALRVCLEANVTEILREAGPEGLHIDQIAEISGLPADKLGRILRFLAIRHIYKEVKPDVFANTRLSGVLDTGKSVEAIKADPAAKDDDTSGFPALLGSQYDETAKAADYLWEMLADPASAESGEVTHTAFNKAFDTDMSVWPWYEKPENSARRRRFGAAMRGVVAMQPANQIFEAFDWESLPEGAKVVDVGGGVGTSSLALAGKFESMNIVVQDQASVVVETRKLLATELPDAVESGRVEIQAHDFFTEQPVKDASVFLLKMILHDWDDTYAVKILAQLRAAAQPDTKLVVIDSILAFACSIPEGDAMRAIPGAVPPEAPAPLIPNYGVAGGLGYCGDLNMMVMFNARERTLAQLMSLLTATGWKLVEVKQSGGATNFKQSAIAVPI